MKLKKAGMEVLFEEITPKPEGGEGPRHAMSGWYERGWGICRIIIFPVFPPNTVSVYN